MAEIVDPGHRKSLTAAVTLADAFNAVPYRSTSAGPARSQLISSLSKAMNSMGPADAALQKELAAIDKEMAALEEPKGGINRNTTPNHKP